MRQMANFSESRASTANVPEVSVEHQILIVDDDVRHASSVRDLLSAHGYQVDYETRGADGLSRLGSDAIDILILDLNMPDLSGIEVLQSLSRTGRQVKTIVVSGESAVDNVTPILRLGAYDYLPKPYEPAQLLTSVRNALQGIALERQNRAMGKRQEAANKRHEFLVNASPDLIYLLDKEGNFSFINNQLRNVFDYNSGNLLGHSWHQLLGERSAQLEARLQYRMNERRTGDRATTNLEFDFEVTPGNNHILELSAMGLYSANDQEFSGTYGILRDVTPSRSTARRLAQSQQKFYGLFMNSPDPVFMSRLEDGLLIEGNENFMALISDLDSTPFEQVDAQSGDNMSVQEVVTDHALWTEEHSREEFIQSLKAAPHRFQRIYDRTLGNQLHSLEITARMLDIDGASCMLAAVRDLTEQKRAENDRLQLEKQLQESSKMEAIGQLAGGIAHDFNNILASIIGYTELALSNSSRSDSKQVQNYLAEVVTAGQRARDLISQMLTFTRTHRGNAQQVDMRQSISEVSRMLRAAIPRSIEIDTAYAESLPAINIDPVQLQQIVINLLINARDAISGPGRIQLDVRPMERQQHCASCDRLIEGEYIQLSVADSGHGIPDTVLPSIFEMFVSTREPGRGTGIGLWLIHTIVHEYQGHINVESTPGKGTTFRIFFPNSIPDIEPVNDSGLYSVVDIPPSGKVLIIDDEVSVSNFLGEVMSSAGYDVVIYKSSPEALDYLQHHVDELSLIITDYAMPNISGLDIAEHAKLRNKALPVIVISGHASNLDLNRLDGLAIESFLPKPFRIDELLSQVRKLVGPQVSRSE